jgi:hypothetical protein
MHSIHRWQAHSIITGDGAHCKCVCVANEMPPPPTLSDVSCIPNVIFMSVQGWQEHHLLAFNPKVQWPCSDLYHRYVWSVSWLTAHSQQTASQNTVHKLPLTQTQTQRRTFTNTHTNTQTKHANTLGLLVVTRVREQVVWNFRGWVGRLTL